MIMQHYTGTTYLNCKAGQPIYFRQGNVTVSQFDVAGSFYVNKTLSTSVLGVSFVGQSKISSNMFVYSNELNPVIRNSGGYGALYLGWYHCTTTYVMNASHASDRRLKHDIEDFVPKRHIFDIINDVKVRAFKWNDSTGDVHLGAIAQEIEDIPELAFLVSSTKGKIDEDIELEGIEGETKERKHLQSEGLTMVNTKAIQELIGEKEKSNERIEDLERLNKDLLSRIISLEELANLK